MVFGFMNKKEQEFYNQTMYELLEDKMDAYGRVPRDAWRIADRITRNLMKTFIQNGIL